MDPKPHHNSSPSPSTSLLRDISNFKTPKPRNPSFSLYQSPQYFTPSNRTPATSAAPRSKAARRLRAFEIEQSRSARKAQMKKIQSLKSLSKSLSVWLNFLLEKPESCGCDLSRMEGGGEEGAGGKRGREGGGREEGASWRREKRQKGASWRGGRREEEVDLSGLEGSLRDVCSFDDLKERMNFVGLGGCKEIFAVMAQVTKTIDEGRLQMKAHCPIVTDVGLKEKAFKILMCYNPTWLRTGLYVIFGGDSLLREGDVDSEEEIAFLKMVIDKQFFSHAGLAKKFAYNKLVEGLYRAGYYETLGSIILKRFLLLVLILDRTKSQSCLPIKYGIDGLDGGSPLLFTLQSNIKSNSQVIHDFLSSDVMHGEGSVLAHLLIVGYKVSHQQSPLNEYDFKVTELFEDFRDGVRLCRVVQLLQHDTSLLMKMVVPSDSHKKNVVNCGIALKTLKQAGVPLCDEDGLMIEEEDIISGDKELTLSLLWNVFVHLQLPLLINRTLLLEEISRIHGVSEENMKSLALLDILLKWIQAICETYSCKVDGFSSLVDGKAMWCLLDYYFRKELKCSCSHKDLKETSIMSASDYTDAVHNFLLSQKLTTLMGNFPEVLEVSDVLEHNGACNSKSVIVLLVFLSFQLIVKKNTDQLNFHKILGCVCQSPARKASNMRKCFVHSEEVLNQGVRHGNDTQAGTRDFKAIMAWWQDMASLNKRFHQQPIPISPCLSSGRDSSIVERENGATIIQSYFRKFVERKDYLRKKKAVLLLQTVIRAWLEKKKLEANKSETQKQLEVLSRCIIFIGDRRMFLKLKRSATLIQHAVREWIWRRHHDKSILVQNLYAHEGHVEPSSLECETIEENAIRTRAISIVQLAWRNFVLRKVLREQHLAATKIQSCYRVWFARKRFLMQKQAAIIVQSAFRCLKTSRSYKQCKVATRSAMVIQSHTRGWIARRGMHRLKLLILTIQSHWRGYLARRNFLIQKAAVIKVQGAFQSTQWHKVFLSYKQAATEIQRFIRGQLARRRVLGASLHYRNVPTGDILISGVGLRSINLIVLLQSVVKLQRWWRNVLMQKSEKKAAVVIQSNYRGWIARKQAIREKLYVAVIQRWWRDVSIEKSERKSAIVIQSHTRGWIARSQATREKLNVAVIQRWWRDILMQKSETKAAIFIQSHTRGWIARRRAIKEKFCVAVIQRWWRGVLTQKTRTKSAIIIQFYTRRWLARQKTTKERHALMQNTRMKSAIVLQSYTRRWLARQETSNKKLVLMQNLRMRSAIIIQAYTRQWLVRREIIKERHVLMQNTRMRAAIIIQSYTRRWLSRRETTRERHRITVIQSYWKGYLARKDSRGQLLDLRLRVRKSAANVDDGMRIINRLVAALSDLLDMKSVTGILHTCKTLDMATQHSQKCCEKLVEAGAIDTLLKLIRSVSRSVPDQEVLKHALSTLRNVARYSHLVEELIANHGSVTTIFLEFLRNKEDGYFMASELLKKICSNPKGVEAIRSSPAFLKRLNNLVEDLKRQAANEKRNMKGLRAKEQVERRLGEAAELLKLISNG